MNLYTKEREGINPMPTAKAGAQCRVPVPRVEIVMLEKLNCILSKRATRPVYI